MKRSVTGRLGLIVIFVSIAIFYVLKPMTLGLDLQGGMHLVLEVEGEKAVENAVERVVVDIKELLEKEKVVVKSIERNGNAIFLVTPSESETVVAKVLDRYPNFRSKQEGERKVLSLKEAEVKHILEASTSQALETIRNRIDQFGVSEPLIQKQGENQILVQLPGIKDPKRAMELIGRTALLEFRLLDDENPIARLFPTTIEPDAEQRVLKEFKDRIPADREILFERRIDQGTGDVTKRPYLVLKRVSLTGDVISDARVAIGNFNEPYVSITFDQVGARLFEKVTAENMQKRLAIVLDKTIYSTPTIQDKISGGRAQITGSFTTNEANDLSIALRAGALPAPVSIIQNVTVGPSLGQDSIEKGIRTSLIGALLVVIYMIFYYRLSGLLANIMLCLNLLFLVGALSALHATLTLPGIAAIVLTVGMAVDSNVLIYERIRDEIRKNRPVRLAIDAGYEKAFSSIFDSHVTTLITALALFLFGTGPIKGFAVSLSLGVIINLFTALVGTKVVFDIINRRFRIEQLSI
ncbi:MAG: protein translocase subunit SecD [Nitrospirae bacterium]|nr:protein translocase subunit SecD [Candidatus Troglogloeales bacterium]